MATNSRTSNTRSAPAGKSVAKRTRPNVPAGAKLPSDHQSAKEEVKGAEFWIIEWKGHEYTIARESFDDVEVVEYFTDDNIVGALRLILTPEEWAKYKERSRNEQGRSSFKEASEFLEHIMNELQAKNS